MSSASLLLYVARRLLVMVVLLVVTSLLIFSLVHLAPGSPVDSLLGLRPRTPETVKALTQQYHLDDPFFVQYWEWAKQVLHGNLGTSTQTSLPVADELKSRLPTSLLLGGYAFILTMVGGIAAGAVSALKKRTAVDRGIVAMTIVGLGMPAFVAGILLLYVFSIVLGWFPASGAGQGFADQLWHLTLPAVALSLVSIAFVAKHTRAAMITVLDQDYVTFARAQGLSASEILFGYTLRNALISVVTISALTLSFLITGAVLVEVVFSVPGIGTLLVQAANTKDVPTIQATGLFIAAVIMVANLLGDLLYLAVDPRIRFGTFFMRMEFTPEGLPLDAVAKRFAVEVAEPFGMDWRMWDTARRRRMAILVSRYDHCLLDLLWRWRRDQLEADVVLVVSNHEDLRSDVEAFGLPYEHVPVARGEKPAAEAKLVELLRDVDVDVVVLARYMQVLSGDFLARVGVPVINIHHSFLPAFAGAGPYERAKERGVKLIGATAHYVTEELDAGPIVEQDVIRVTHREDAAALERLGADIERVVFARAVQWHCEDRVLVHGNTTVVF